MRKTQDTRKTAHLQYNVTAYSSSMLQESDDLMFCDLWWWWWWWWWCSKMVCCKDFGDYKLAPIIETGSFLATRSFTAKEICPWWWPSLKDQVFHGSQDEYVDDDDEEEEDSNWNINEKVEKICEESAKKYSCKGRQMQLIVKFSIMVRGCVISSVLMMLMWLVQCDDHPTQFDFISGKYDLHKLPPQNTSGPFLVQVYQAKLSIS